MHQKHCLHYVFGDKMKHITNKPVMNIEISKKELKMLLKREREENMKLRTAVKQLEFELRIRQETVLFEERTAYRNKIVKQNGKDVEHIV